MRRAAFGLAVFLLVVVAGCSSDDGGEAAPSNEPASSAIPSPDAAQAQQLVDDLAAVLPSLADDPDATVDLARNSCSSIVGGANNVTDAVRVRFTVDGVEPTDAQVGRIVEVIEGQPWCR